MRKKPPVKKGGEEMKANQELMKKALYKEVEGRRKEFCEAWEMNIGTLEKLVTGFNPISPEKFCCWMQFTGKADLNDFVNGRGMNQDPEGVTAEE